MKTIRVVGALAGLAFLAGCAGLTGQSTVESLEGVEPVGTDFTKQLFAEYRDFANFEWYDMLDAEDAVHFAEKALAAGEGNAVLPEELGNWRLPESRVPDITDARARLMAALDASARDSAPIEAAIAQARFDCWVEQQEENHQPEDIAECEQQFEEAMAALEAAMAPVPVAAAVGPSVFFVFFDFDSSEITSDAADILSRIAGNAGGNSVDIVGHADKSGSDAYNQALSERRAVAVENALIGLGASGSMMTSGVGENEPLVPTEDGVREPSNRRAVITIQ